MDTKGNGDLEGRLKAKMTALTTTRDQIRMQLNGIENQLYILDQMINPKPEEAPQPSEKGADTPDGTI